MQLIKRNMVVIVVSFIIQYAWEYTACGYFYENSVVDNMNELMFEATVGDVLITLVIFNIMAILYKNTSWKLNRINIFGISLYGISAAMYFESRALMLGRWAYSSKMPYLVDTNIGLLPILQFALLIPLTVIIENYISKRFGSVK